MKRLLGVLTLIGLLLMFAHPPVASASSVPAFKLTLEPIYENKVLRPGSENKGFLTIYNQGQSPIFYTVYATPYGVTNESYTQPDFKPLPGKPNISSWFHFTNPGSVITQSQANTIDYTIDVPANTPAGGYYAAVFVQSENSPDKKDAKGVNINDRVGELFYIEVPGSVIKKSKVASWGARLLQSNKVSANLRLENAGSIHFFAAVKVTFHSIFGGSNYSLSLDKVVLPQTTRQIPISLANPPGFALYRVSGNVKAFSDLRLGNKYILVVSRSTWIKVLIALGLVVLIILLDSSIRSIIHYSSALWRKLRK